MIRINWEVEEIVALIAIYNKSCMDPSINIDNELAALSTALNRRANILGIQHDEKFRNMNGMKMMYQNVLYVATNGEKGLSAAGQSLYSVYEMMKKTPDVFKMILKEFDERYQISR